MSLLDDLRRQDPRLQRVDDATLINALRGRPEYRGMTDGEFAAVTGIGSATAEPGRNSESILGLIGDGIDAAQMGAYQVAQGLGDFANEYTGFGRGLRDFGKQGADRQLEEMSPRSAEAIQQEIFESTGDGFWDFKLGEGANPLTLYLQTASLAGEAVTTGLGAGSVARGGTSFAGRIIGNKARNEALAKGASKEIADRAALEAAADFAKSRTANGVMLGTYGLAEMAINTGQIADGARQEVLAMPWEELDQSQAYIDTYWSLARENSDLSTRELREMARQQLADATASLVMRDPALLLTNAVMGGYGGKVLDDLVTKGTKGAGGRLGEAVRQFAIQGTTEFAMGAHGQYASNVAIAEGGADPTRSPIEGVMAAGLSEATVGGTMGAGAGLAAGRNPEADRAARKAEEVAAARAQAAANGGDALDQTLAGEAAEQAAVGRNQAEAAAERPGRMAEVGNRLQMAQGMAEELASLSVGSPEADVRVRSVQGYLQRAEEAFDKGQLDLAERHVQRAEQTLQRVNAGLATPGSRENPMAGDVVGPEGPLEPAGLLGGPRRTPQIGSDNVMYAGGPTADTTQYDPQARTVRRDEELVGGRRAGERMRAESAPAQPRLTDQGIIYGEGPTTDQRRAEARERTRRALGEQYGTARNTALDGELLPAERRPAGRGTPGVPSRNVTVDGEVIPPSPRQLTDQGIIYGERPPRQQRGTRGDEQAFDPRFNPTVGRPEPSRPAPRANARPDADRPAQGQADGSPADAGGRGEVRLRANGKPFASEKSAKLSKPFKENPGARVVEVEGGYGIELGDVRMRSNTGSARGMSADRVRQAARPLSRRGLRVEVVDSADDLPPKLRAKVRRDGVQDRVAGLFDPDTGTSYLVAANIDDAAQAVRTVLHETVGHEGVAKVLGDKLAGVMQEIYRSMPGRAREVIEQAYAKQLERMSPEKARQVVAEEYVAHLAETDPQNSLLDKLVKLVRDAIRTLFGGEKAWDRADVVDLIAQSRRAMANRPDLSGLGERAEPAYKLKDSEAPKAKPKAKKDEKPKRVRKISAEASQELADLAALDTMMPAAQAGDFRNNRELKVFLQENLAAAAKKHRVDLTAVNPEIERHLTALGVRDAKEALKTNANAVGWYDETVTKALEIVSLVHPEIKTDREKRFAFTYALAVTSNGIKVDKNFELAEKAYEHFKRTGEMPTNIQAGQAQKAINEHMELFNLLVEQMGAERLSKFMNSEFTVNQLTRMGFKITGENAGTRVRGSMILGPKIGNGFFSNLNGYFDALTMDRWLMRTWGRWTGTLIESRPDMVRQKRDELRTAVRALKEDKAATKAFEQALGAKLQTGQPDKLAQQIQKASVDPKVREIFNQTEAGESLRKVGNALAKYIDGQKEAPANGNERNWIRKVFSNMLSELRSEGYNELTMSDLQALLWYPERRIYDMAKSDGDVTAGYADDEAPDYANAAAGLARDKGVSQQAIDNAIKEVTSRDRGRSAATRRDGQRDAGESQEAQPQAGRRGQQDDRQLDRRERSRFLKRRIFVAERLGRDGDAKVRSFSRKSRATDRRLRGVEASYKPTTKFANLLEAAELGSLTLDELVSTPENVERFSDAITASKEASEYGAAVYVYPAEEYAEMRLFLTEDGTSGFALKDDGDVVSVFSDGGGKVHAMLALAIEEGGTKLDAFETVLPELYAINGFKEVARDPWNEKHRPENWDKERFKEFNNGEPDVVYMAYDPDHDPYYGGDDTPRYSLRGDQDGNEGRERARDGEGREGAGQAARGALAASEQAAARQEAGEEGRVGPADPLPGAPRVEGFTGPDPRLVKVAEDYAKANGIPLRRQAEYVEVDEARAARIAEAYAEMEHAPQDPKVREAYQNLIQQTRAQYDALVDAGYQFWFTDLGRDDNLEYLSSPWNAMRDIRDNQAMGVFPTDEGFGSSDLDVNDNPLLEDTGLEWPVGALDGPMKKVLANDLFRAVHDAFGHGLEGSGFRARGEENAWQAHVRLFTGSAVGAITSETRGQNSWLNYGPHGEANRTAKVEDTIFADQKTGLMPEWTWTEGLAGDMEDDGGRYRLADVDADYLAAVARGDMEAAQEMVAKAAEEAGVPVFSEEGVTAYKVRRGAPPTRTQKAYKLFRVKRSQKGEVFALFVGATDPLPQGAWLDAEAGPEADPSKTGKRKVKSKIGNLAYRPGWHAGDLPLATHIGAKDADGNVFARKDDEVWAEVEMAADVDYQPEADANGRTKSGEFSAALADIKAMPTDGLYRYKTNPNMTGNWIISGSMKINRILSEKEVNRILAEGDVAAMPWAEKKRGAKEWTATELDLDRWGLGTNPARNMKKLLDPVTYDDDGRVIPLSQRFNTESDDPRYSVTTAPLSSFFDDMDAEMARAFDKIGPRTPKQRLKEWWAALVDRIGVRLRQGVVDRFAALRELDEKAHGKGVLSESITSSSWALARMANAASGALHAMMTTGRIYYDASEKVIDLRDGDAKGLGEVLGRLGEPAEIERFMGWIAGNRSAKLAAEGRENLFTETEIAALQRANQGKMKDGRARSQVYAEVFREFQQYRDDVLAIAEKAGIISEDQRAMWRDEFYVPFYRVNEDDRRVTGMLATSGLSRQQAFKKLKGGSANLNDLLQNTMMNFNHLLEASLKNMAAAQALENAEAVGIAEQIPAAGDPKTSTFVMVDGKKVHYEVSDPLVYGALTALAHPGFNQTSMKILRSFKRLFTNLTTSTPQFQVANLIRDSLQAVATNNVSKNALANVVKGGMSYKQARTRARMMAAGGAFNFGHLYGTNPDELRAQLTKTMRNAKLIDGPAAIPGALRAGWEAWQQVNNFTENMNRAAIWEHNLKEGKGKLASAFEARDLIDFSAHGTWPAVRFLIDVVPFLNARIQGLDKIYRSGLKPGANVLLEAFGKGEAGVTDKQAAARFWAVTGALTVATLALYAHNHDDEEYEKLEDWMKDTYWFFRAGDKAFFIPKPFEVGAIATIAERMLEQAMDDKATGALFRERMMHMATDTFSFTVVPQALQPVLNVYSNRDDFTGRPIETMGMERLSPELRRNDRTTFAAQGISTALNSTVGAIGNPDSNPLSLSPVQVDHLIQGYLGSIGAMVTGTADTLWRSASGQTDPAKHWYEYQPVRRFYRNLGDEDVYTKYGTVFYEAMREAQRAHADVQEMVKMGHLEKAREAAQSNRELLLLRPQLNRAQTKLRTISQQMDMVRRSNLSPAEKRQQLDRLRALRNRIHTALGEQVLKQRAN